MALSNKKVPLKKLWNLNLLLSAIFNFMLCAVSTASGNLIFFVLTYFSLLLSFWILVDWKCITLSLNIVGQVFSLLSTFCLCYSPKISENLFDAEWQRDTLNWFFPFASLHSICVSIPVLALKLKYKVKDEFVLKDVIELLKNCDTYFLESKRIREQILKEKKLEKEMRKIEIQKEEEVAKKIVDSLYSFTNRSNFPELENKPEENFENEIIDKTTNILDTVEDDEEINSYLSEIKVNRNIEDYNVRISIPEDLDSLSSLREQKENYIHWDSKATFDDSGSVHDSDCIL